MNPQQRPGQITYYDELGVAPNASSEEIRDAFRALARLLHPDQHTDPQLKEMAEKQMRRLNPIYAALNDPLRRQLYDEDLRDGYTPTIVVGHPPPRDFRRLARRGVWIGAIIIGSSVLLWLASDNPILPAFQDREDHAAEVDTHDNRALPPVTTGTDSLSEVARLRTELSTLTLQRDAAVNELARRRGLPPAAAEPGRTIPSAPRTASSRSLPATTMTELPVAAKLLPAAAVLSPLVADTPAAGRHLAGFWFYVKPPAGQNNKNKTLYPPEYIEATLSEENGVLHGNYRSRFQIVDRAISPEVNFTFIGTPGISSFTAPWTGPGGARGDVTLKLMPDNTLQVDWIAYEPGSQMGLVSGTAVLTRRVD